MAPDPAVPKGPKKTKEDKNGASVGPGSGAPPTDRGGQDVSKCRVHDSAIGPIALYH